MTRQLLLYIEWIKIRWKNGIIFWRWSKLECLYCEVGGEGGGEGRRRGEGEVGEWGEGGERELDEQEKEEKVVFFLSP